MKMNEVEFISFAQMRRHAALQRETQIRRAASAANGDASLVSPPKGVSKARWRAMIAFLLKNGTPS